MSCNTPSSSTSCLTFGSSTLANARRPPPFAAPRFLPRLGAVVLTACLFESVRAASLVVFAGSIALVSCNVSQCNFGCRIRVHEQRARWQSVPARNRCHECDRVAIHRQPGRCAARHQRAGGQLARADEPRTAGQQRRCIVHSRAGLSAQTGSALLRGLQLTANGGTPLVVDAFANITLADSVIPQVPPFSSLQLTSFTRLMLSNVTHYLLVRIHLFLARSRSAKAPGLRDDRRRAVSARRAVRAISRQLPVVVIRLLGVAFSLNVCASLAGDHCPTHGLRDPTDTLACDLRFFFAH